MAASVAAQLSNESDVEVETARGGLGEFSVAIDGQKIVDTNLASCHSISFALVQNDA